MELKEGMYFRTKKGTINKIDSFINSNKRTI